MPTIYGPNTKADRRRQERDEINEALHRQMASRPLSLRLLDEILDSARTLLNDGTAGGSRQYAFELMVDQDDLVQAASLLEDLRNRIDQELGR